MRTAFILIILMPFGVFAQTGFELHVSVNHPLSSDNEARTFYGAGIGANVLFADTSLVSFKTGVEFNFFHTWDSRIYAGHFASQTNVHYQYVALAIPAIVRFSFGREFKLFIESGAYVGVGYGKMRSDYSSYSPYNNTSFKGYRYDEYFPGLSFTPMFGLGGRFPLFDRMDLVLKPEFAFVLNEFGSDNGTEFNRGFFYAKLSLGIHLK